MRNILVLWLSLLLWSGHVWSADFKVGYVQVDKLLQEAPQTVETGKKLEKEFSPRSLDLEKLQKQIRDIEAQLDHERTNVNESERRVKERQLNNMRLEFQSKQRELREDINLRKNEELAVLQERINKAVQTVAESEGYDLVAYSGIAYASKRIDITDKVLKLLGKK
ncbi:MAG: OmpH family outer membrane protein [Methylophilus sp.]|uniref:OmpH family outer membrane protein n=1 Tax=Methylophilus sp. TaxID=29541 RepID=UPI003F9FA3E5